MDIRPIDTTLLNLSEEQINKACKSLTEMHHAIEHFYDLIHDADNSKVNQTNRDTMLYLFHSHYKELCKTLDYQDAEIKQENDRLQMLKNANQKAHELTQKLGEKIILTNSATELTAALRFYQNIFTAYYEQLGFHYASEKRMTVSGIEYEFSEEIETTPTHHLTRDKKLIDTMQKHVSHLFGTNTDFDIIEDGYRTELLATDDNKDRLIEIFTRDLPISDIRGFYDKRNDYGSYSIRIHLFVSYKDISNLYKKISMT